MSSRPWEVLVREARDAGCADPTDRWTLGDLALEAVPPPDQGRDAAAAAQRRLAEFADAADITFSKVKDCWYTSAAWPVGRRFPDVSHAKHSRYRGRPNPVALLLNEQIDDGLSSPRLRDKVARAEKLLADGDVRAALLDRSVTRSARIREAARALDSEELLKARIDAKIAQEDQKARLAAPHLLARLEERFIRANTVLARMVADLLDLTTVVDQTPLTYRDRTEESLGRVERAAQQCLAKLRPEQRPPQPHDVIDMTLDD